MIVQRDTDAITVDSARAGLRGLRAPRAGATGGGTAVA